LKTPPSNVGSELQLYLHVPQLPYYRCCSSASQRFVGACQLQIFLLFYQALVGTISWLRRGPFGPSNMHPFWPFFPSSFVSATYTLHFSFLWKCPFFTFLLLYSGPLIIFYLGSNATPKSHSCVSKPGESNNAKIVFDQYLSGNQSIVSGDMSLQYKPP
jgi:hypothetical protein